MYPRKVSIHFSLVSAGLMIPLTTGTFSGVPIPATSADDENQLEYVSPEEVGRSSEELDKLKQFAQQSGYAAMMAVFDGKSFFHWAKQRGITPSLLS